MTKLKSDLETKRATELDELLKIAVPKILEFIDKADPASEKYQTDALGKFNSPETLKKVFVRNSDLERGIKGDSANFGEVIDKVLQYSVNTWSPGFLDKLYASNNPVGVISDLILSVLNTNSHVYTVSPVLSVIENYIGRKYAQLFFANNQDTCGGLTFAGGSWSNVTSMQIARSLKFPETKEFGNGNHKFAIYTSSHCHYSIVKSAILLGLGSANVFKVSINEDGTMNTGALKQTIQDSVKNGFTPLYINATAGTTVFGSYDPFEEIHQIASEFDCWFHVDASWGGNVVFSEKQKHKLAGTQHADSLTVNPHKMLGVPTTCSFLLLPHVGNFQKAMSLSAPYLFHGREKVDVENYDLADGTMGCGRRADAFKFYMAWLYYGYEGFANRVDHAFAVVQDFVTKVSHMPDFELVLGDVDNLPPCLQVCFYYRPKGYDATDLTPVTRYISRKLHTDGKYLVDFSPNPSASGNGSEFFRVVFNSPILTDRIVDDLLLSIVNAGKSFSHPS